MPLYARYNKLFIFNHNYVKFKTTYLKIKLKNSKQAI